MLRATVLLLAAADGARGAGVDDEPVAALNARVQRSIVRMSVVEAGPQAPLSSGARAPPIEGKHPDGTAVKVELAAGAPTPTLVNVWATWCGPCVREIPALARASERYKGRVRFLGLAEVGERSTNDEVVAAVARFAIPYEVVEIEEATSRAWNVSALPSTFLVDAAGAVAWSVVGPLDEAALDAHLGAMLDSPAAAAALLPGEQVLGEGFALREDGVIVTSHEVISQADPSLVAVGADGHAWPVLGVLVDDEERGLAVVKIAALVPPLALAPTAVHVGAEVLLPGARALATVGDVGPSGVRYRAPSSSPVPSGAPLVDSDGRVVAVNRSGGPAVAVDALRALAAGTALDAEPTPLGRSVKRNLLISAVVFGCVALGFAVPPVVERMRAGRRRRPGPPMRH